MGADRAPHAGAEGSGAAANSAAAGCCGCIALHFADGLSVASAAARFSEPLDRAALFLHVADGRSMGTDQFPAGPAFPGTGRPRGQPLGWRDRQPIGQNHGKWWPAGWSLSSGGPSARPGDAGKKINGRKRHIITDTSGHLVGVQVHAADVQDRDGAPDLLASIRYLFPWLRHVFADGAYTGEKLETALAGRGQWTLEIVKRSDQVTGFQVLPRRWVVERTFAWFGRNRRLAKDFETTLTSSEAWLYLASVQLLARRLADPPTSHRCSYVTRHNHCDS